MRVCVFFFFSDRHFTRSDAKKVSFKPSFTLPCAQALSKFISTSSTLQHVILRHNKIHDVIFHVIAEAGTKSTSLQSLDVTGNVIGDDVKNDVIKFMAGAKTLRTLYLHENEIREEVRKVLVEESAGLEDFTLSL